MIFRISDFHKGRKNSRMACKDIYRGSSRCCTSEGESVDTSCSLDALLSESEGRIGITNYLIFRRFIGREINL